MRIAIIGAGICGLTTAACLKYYGVKADITIYEADAAASARPQGYAIGLKDESGLGVLRQLGLRDGLIARDNLRIKQFNLVTQTGQRLLAAAANKGRKKSTYRIKRPDIIDVLHQYIQGAPIHYGKRFVTYSHNNNIVRLQFADGSTAEAEYVIGADGAGSAVREQMLPLHKRFTGLISIAGSANIGTRNEPLLDDAFFIMLGNNATSLLAYKQTQGVYFSHAFAIDTENGLADKTNAELAEIVRKHVHSWASPANRIAEAIAVDSLAVRPFFDILPQDQLFDGNVWLIGDAAHPMTPWQGQAANIGMLDAQEVALLLHDLQHKPNPAAVRRLERRILKRGRKNVLKSRQTGADFHLSDPKEQHKRNTILRIVNVFIQGVAAIKWLLRQA